MNHAEMKNTNVNNVDEKPHFETYLMIKKFVDCNRLFGTSYESIYHYGVIDRING